MDTSIIRMLMYIDVGMKIALLMKCSMFPLFVICVVYLFFLLS